MLLSQSHNVNTCFELCKPISCNKKNGSRNRKVWTGFYEKKLFMAELFSKFLSTCFAYQMLYCPCVLNRHVPKRIKIQCLRSVHTERLRYQTLHWRVQRRCNPFCSSQCLSGRSKVPRVNVWRDGDGVAQCEQVFKQRYLRVLPTFRRKIRDLRETREGNGHIPCMLCALG